MNFTSLIHGDIGALTSSYLSLSSLARWSRCDRNAMQCVNYAFSHHKQLDLRTQSTMSLDAFIRLCERIRGVEILKWAISHPCMMTHKDGETFVVPEGIHAFDRLLRNNAPSLRVLQQDNDKDVYWTMLSESEMSYMIVPVLHAAKSIPNLRVLTLASDMKFETAAPLSTSEQNYFCVHDSQRRHQFKLRTYEQVMEHIERRIKKNRGDKQEVEEKREEEAVSTVGTHSSPYSQLRVYRVILEHTQLNQLFQLTPKANACQLLINSSTLEITEESVARGDCMVEPSGTPLRDHSIRFSTSSHALHQSLSASLLYLTIDIHSNVYPSVLFPPYTQLELQLPHCRELIINLSWLGISDVLFVCPQLIKADIQCICLAPEEMQSADEGQERVYQSQPPSLLRSLKHSANLKYLICFGLSGEDVVGCDVTPMLSQEEKSMMEAKAVSLNQPPLFVDPMVVEEDGDGDDGAAKVNEEKRRCSRVFHYALSLLPCAQHHLKFLDDDSLHLSFHEYVTLFPRFVNMSIVPEWLLSTNQTVWLRPIGTNDFISQEHGMKLMTHMYQSHDGTAKKIEQLLAEADDGDMVAQTVTDMERDNKDEEMINANYFHFASSSVHITLEVTQLLHTSGRLAHLHYLFLHSPTRVDSAALTMLFRESHSLAHVTLWQLRGCGNSVFTSLTEVVDGNDKQQLQQQLIVRPSLLTLRMKVPCHADPVDNFNGEVLPSLTRLFPSLQHLEFFSPVALDEKHNFGIRLDAILTVNTQASGSVSSSKSSSPDLTRSIAWPGLHQLVVNEYDWSGNLPLQAIIRERLAISPLPTNIAFQLHCVSVPCDTPSEERRDDWQTNSAERRMNVDNPSVVEKEKQADRVESNRQKKEASSSRPTDLIVHREYEYSCCGELCEYHKDHPQDVDQMDSD